LPCPIDPDSETTTKPTSDSRDPGSRPTSSDSKQDLQDNDDVVKDAPSQEKSIEVALQDPPPLVQRIHQLHHQIEPVEFLNIHNQVQVLNSRPYDAIFGQLQELDNPQDVATATFHSLDRHCKGVLWPQDVEYWLRATSQRHNIPMDPETLQWCVLALLQDYYDAKSDTIRPLTETDFGYLVQKVAYTEEAHQKSRDSHVAQFQQWNGVNHIIGLFILALIHAAVFGIQAWQVAQKESAAFTLNVLVAKGSAACLNLDGALILIPMLHHLWACLPWLRFLPDPTVMHVVMGCFFLVFSCLHVGAHVINYARVVQVQSQDDLKHSIASLLGVDYVDDLPAQRVGRWNWLLRLRASWTGIIMTLCLFLGYLAMNYRRSSFGIFWNGHQLLLVCLALQCLHGTQNLLDQFKSVYWIGVPLLAYMLPRIFRSTSMPNEVVDVEVVDNGVEDSMLRLTVVKPYLWEFTMGAGMYARINLPGFSSEWHPFSISSCPADDYVTFHIRCVGDWTCRARQEALTHNCRLCLRMQGPFATPTSHYSRYQNLVLVGAGIGVTPMLSILRQLAQTKSAAKVVFFWTVPNQKCFEWFHEQLSQLESMPNLDMRQFLTTARLDPHELGSMVLSTALNRLYDSQGYDVLAGRVQRHRVRMGRPQWEWELGRLDNRKQWGVFVCGPKPMALEIEACCPPGFDFFKESF